MLANLNKEEKAVKPNLRLRPANIDYNLLSIKTKAKIPQKP